MSMIDIIDKPRDKHKAINKPKFKWRNVYYTVKGTKHLGNGIWDTQDIAKTVADSAADEFLLRGYNNPEEIDDYLIPPILCKDFSYHKQMPLGD